MLRADFYFHLCKVSLCALTMDRKTRDGGDGGQTEITKEVRKGRRNGKNIKYRIQVRGRRWKTY